MFPGLCTSYYVFVADAVFELRCHSLFFMIAELVFSSTCSVNSVDRLLNMHLEDYLLRSLCWFHFSTSRNVAVAMFGFSGYASTDTPVCIPHTIRGHELSLIVALSEYAGFESRLIYSLHPWLSDSPRTKPFFYQLVAESSDQSSTQVDDHPHP